MRSEEVIRTRYFALKQLIKTSPRMIMGRRNEKRKETLEKTTTSTLTCDFPEYHSMSAPIEEKQSHWDPSHQDGDKVTQSNSMKSI